MIKVIKLYSDLANERKRNIESISISSDDKLLEENGHMEKKSSSVNELKEAIKSLTTLSSIYEQIISIFNDNNALIKQLSETKEVNIRTYYSVYKIDTDGQGNYTVVEKIDFNYCEDIINEYVITDTLTYQI